MKIKKKILLMSLILCLANTCYAQTKDLSIISLSKKITFCVNKIQSSRNSNHSEEVVSFSDSLEKYNNTLTRYLLKSLQTLKYSNLIDKALNESIIMEKSSDDNKLNLFMWNSQMGGTQEQYVVIAQIKYSNENYKTVLLSSSDSESDDFNFLYDQIRTVELNHQPYYIIIGSQKQSTFTVKKSLQILNLNSSLINEKEYLICDPKGKKYNSISFQFDVNEVKKEPSFNIVLKEKKITMPTRNGVRYFYLRDK